MAMLIDAPNNEEEENRNERNEHTPGGGRRLDDKLRRCRRKTGRWVRPARLDRVHGRAVHRHGRGRRGAHDDRHVVRALRLWERKHAVRQGRLGSAGIPLHPPARQVPFLRREGEGARRSVESDCEGRDGGTRLPLHARRGQHGAPVRRGRQGAVRARGRTSTFSSGPPWRAGGSRSRRM